MTLLYRLANCRSILRNLSADTLGTKKFHSWQLKSPSYVRVPRRNFSFTFVRCKTTEAALSKVEKTSELKRLLILAAPEKWRLAGAIAFLVVSSTVTMAVPFCLGKIIDVIYTEDREETRQNLTKLSLGLLAVFIVGGICNFGRIYLMSTSGHRITQSLRKKSYAAILSQETAMFDRVSTGELVGRLTGKQIYFLASTSP